MLATLNIRRVVLELRLARAEVTPAGSPDTARPTLPENPAWSSTVRSIDELHPGCPARTVNALGEAERLKLPSETVSAMVRDSFAVPDVPVTIAVYVPAATELAAEKVRVLGVSALAVELLKLAVIPLGRAEIARLTLLSLKPTGFTTLIVLVAEVPARRLNVLEDVKRLKLGVEMLRTKVVELFMLPEVPVTVTVWLPGADDALGVNVSVLVELDEMGLNSAVTPAGIPVAVSATLLLNPFWLTMPIVVVVFAPPTSIARVDADEEMLKPGLGTANVTEVVLPSEPEVPSIVTALEEGERLKPVVICPGALADNTPATRAEVNQVSQIGFKK